MIQPTLAQAKEYAKEYRVIPIWRSLPIAARDPHEVFLAIKHLTPGRPADAGICGEVIRIYGSHVPILGVCLGHQGLWRNGRLREIAHARQALAYHAGREQPAVRGTAARIPGRAVPLPGGCGGYPALARLAEGLHHRPLTNLRGEAAGGLGGAAHLCFT